MIGDGGTKVIGRIVPFAAFDNRPIIGSTPEGRPLRETTPQNAQGPIIGHLIPSSALVDDDPVMRRSPDSAAMVEYWDLVDALVDGAEAVRKAGQMFLPRFPDETATGYEARLKLTKYTNVYRDIVEGLSSKPFEQEVTVTKDGNTEPPAEIAEFIENVDGAGNSLTVFSSLTFFNGINSAIDWIFVDHAPVDPTVRSEADRKAKNLKPFWSHVLGRNVLWATSAIINGRETLVYMKLYEPGSPDCVREFVRSPDGVVTWRLLEKQETKDTAGKPQWKEIASGTVTIGVIPLVPFATGRRDGRTFRYFPPMRDAADLQKELYQQESGLKFIKTMGAYSKLAGQGVSPRQDEGGKIIPVSVGPLKVMYAPTDGNGHAGKWEFIQPDPAVMTFLAADVATTIEQLRELGRQPLTAQSSNLTVITASTAAGKAHSAVSAWALLLKDALENAMVITLKFMNITADVPVNVFNEFDDWSDGKDLDALGTAVGAGKISDETYRYELKRRGTLSAEFDEEKEQERLLKQVPSDGPDTEEDPNAPPQTS